MDVIILSGGLGTRLKEVVNDRPKIMAELNGKPFLENTLDELQKFQIKNVILAVGYKKEYIENYFNNKYKDINIIYSEETEPLGTGGAIKKALEKTNESDVIVMNGDVYHKVNLYKLMNEHVNSNSMATITVKELKEFDRFGTVNFDENHVIQSFKEKTYIKKGFINVGVYAIKRDIFEGIPLEQKFSIEYDYFGKYINTRKHQVYLYDDDFIDMGIPSDYEKLKKLINIRK